MIELINKSKLNYASETWTKQVSHESIKNSTITKLLSEEAGEIRMYRARNDVK